MVIVPSLVATQVMVVPTSSLVGQFVLVESQSFLFAVFLKFLLEIVSEEHHEQFVQAIGERNADDECCNIPKTPEKESCNNKDANNSNYSHDGVLSVFDVILRHFVPIEPLVEVNRGYVKDDEKKCSIDYCTTPPTGGDEKNRANTSKETGGA